MKKASTKFHKLYSPNSYPPDLVMAKQHQLANKVGMISDLKDFCACCGKPVNKTTVPMSIPRKELGFLGPLFPLYFKYLLYCILICCLLFVINIYSLVNNYNGKGCE